MPEAGETANPITPKRAPRLVVDRPVAVLQDVYWEDSVAAAMLTDRYCDIDVFRAELGDAAFAQPSAQTRNRYASYFIKWFLPSASFDEPVAIVWKAFHDRAALEHVMRWQFVTSNPLIAQFVDTEFAHVAPGNAFDDIADTYMARNTVQANDKSRNRLKLNLRKIGLAEEHRRANYRIVPDVSPKAIAVLLACLFASEPQAVSLANILADPWWRRIGLVDESSVREKLTETAREGLIAHVTRMDSLDQVTTRYSKAQFAAGKVRPGR